MNILKEAQKLVDGDRQESYGSPKLCLQRTADILSVLLDREVNVKEICMFNIAQKLARTVGSEKRDNWIDAAGYMYIREDKLD